MLILHPHNSSLGKVLMDERSLFYNIPFLITTRSFIFANRSLRNCMFASSPSTSSSFNYKPPYAHFLNIFHWIHPFLFQFSQTFSYSIFSIPYSANSIFWQTKKLCAIPPHRLGVLSTSSLLNPQVFRH